MKIDTFDLGLSALRTYKQSLTREVSSQFSFTEIMAGIQLPDLDTIVTENADGDLLVPVSVNGGEALSVTDRFRTELEKMRQIMEALMAYLDKMTTGSCSCNTFRASDIYLMPIQTVTAWEYTETSSFRYEESEQTRVSAGGTVKTADNREIDFTFDLSMDRSYIREETMTRTATGYAFMDPLIINTGMAAPELAGAGFEFDLDMDGEEEDLPLPGTGVGFLSLDLNGDGIINDGSELFGPTTGDGFGELAAYDLDGNDWIDENDPVFDRLTLWERAESGEDPEGMVLTRIKDAGIGAIYLAGVASPFDLTDGNNELQGRITKTSLALTEEGEVLPVQEMEYKV
ncbi:MAG: hypothetical protein HUN04_12025 [Desulfobacter sp.]|nr:MAG: hypothetical protein HUN04_12025 [Desulfobacter sp.]